MSSSDEAELLAGWFGRSWAALRYNLSPTVACCLLSLLRACGWQNELNPDYSKCQPPIDTKFEAHVSKIEVRVSEASARQATWGKKARIRLGPGRSNGNHAACRASRAILPILAKWPSPRNPTCLYPEHGHGRCLS